MTEKRKVGRPSKYKKEYCESIVEYFDRERSRIVTKKIRRKDGSVEEVDEILPISPATLYGFAASIGVCHDTLLEWKTRHVEFSLAIKRAKALQADHIINNAMEGVCPNAFAIFMMKNNFNWTDRRESTFNGSVSLENLVSESMTED